MCIIPNWVTSTNAPPKSLKDSNASPKVKTMKEEGLGVCSFTLNTSGVKKACWSSEMKTKMSDKWVNYSYCRNPTLRQV